MPVNEKLMAMGSWTLDLVDETPKTDVLDKLAHFGHIAVVAGRLNPSEYGDQLLKMARYVGVLIGKDTDHDSKTIYGQGMALWLGDSNDKGDLIEEPVQLTGATFPNAIRAILGDGTAVVEGVLHSVPGTYTGRHVYESKRKAIDFICTSKNAEWRVNGDATLDAGLAEDLYDAVPNTVIVRRRPNLHTDGDDLELHGLRGDMGVKQDVEDWTSRVVLLAEGQGDAIAVASADNADNPYLDLRGQPVRRVQVVSESTTSAGNAQARAAYVLSRAATPTVQMRMTTDDYDVQGAVSVGAWAWVYDPDNGLLDTENELMFRGERINPIRLRVVGASWPVREGSTVAYRAKDGTWLDLTPYVDFEGGETAVDVGDLMRALAGGSVEPVGPRPIPDSSVPGPVTWDLPFETGVYVGSGGETRARMLVKWLLPLNTDGSTVLDGDHYEIQYGVSPVAADQWQTSYAPWGTLQAMINDLVPGLDHDFRIRAVDSSGHQGAWSSIQTEQTNADTVAPSTPAPPTVAGSLIAIQIVHRLGKASGGEWNLEPDLNHLEVHVGPDDSFTPDEATLKGQVSAHAGMIAAHIPAVGTVDVEETTARWVRVIAVDSAGNRSSPSSAVTATAVLIDDAHISSLTATKITTGELRADIVLGARIKTADSGQRVEINSGGLSAYNNAGTLLVSLQANGVFFLRSATSGARLDFSNISGVQVFNAAGTRTAWLNVDGYFELRSAASGARIQLDGTGLKAFNSSGQQTVDVAAGTGNVTLVGQLATGFTGRRVVIDPSTNDVKFYPSSGSVPARIVEYAAFPGYGSLSFESAVMDFDSKQASIQLQPNHAAFTLGNANAPGGYHARIIMTNNAFELHGTYGGTQHRLECTSAGWRLNGNTIKSFIIPHPVDEDRWLIHGCTESPNNGVEYWGLALLDESGHAEVLLPDYFEALTAYDGRAVLLTGLGDPIAPVSATYPEDGRFAVHGGAGQRVSWLVKAIRRDVPPLLVAPRRDEVNVHGRAPYLYYTPKESHDRAPA